jgi:deazaflavin-dependent oxidoreductase (nitroreductase family)
MAQGQATRKGAAGGKPDPLANVAFDRANAVQRFNRRFAASGPGSWMFARVLHHIDKPIYRITRGRNTLGGLLSGLPVVMLTTHGKRTGLPRTVPVLGLPTPDGFAVIASNYGQRDHPAWYHNLHADPTGELTVDGVTRPFRATVAEGEVRERIWREGLRVYPGWSQYERRCAPRKIDVFILGAPGPATPQPAGS